MVVTFYSFKGGVGRSMAIANVAEILAAAGYRVIVCDWDLEAPGLERYFVDSQEEATRFTNKRGVIDLLLGYKEKVSKPVLVSATDAEDELDFENPFHLTVELFKTRKQTTDSTNQGSIRILGAGKREGDNNKAYSEAVQSFDWTEFYEKWGGGSYIEFFRSSLEKESDIVLVDSRTGITEQSGVCTHHLADLVVLFTAANDANTEGTKWMAEKLSRPELKTLRGERPIVILPVAARIEQTSQAKELGNFRESFKNTFYQYVVKDVNISEEIFTSAEIPYIPYYSFKEKLVARENSATRHRQLYSAYESLSRIILTIGHRSELLTELPDSLTLEPIAEYSSEKQGQAEVDTHSVLQEHQEWCRSSQKTGSRAILRNANLGGMRLSGFVLDKADLEGANLNGANLTNASLAEVNLKYANLTSANISNANLRRANLQDATLDNANLEGANLQGATVVKASFRRANLSNADFQNAVVEDANFLDALITGAKFNDSIGLRQQQVEHAVSDKHTIFPSHISAYASSKAMVSVSAAPAEEKKVSASSAIEKAKSILRGEEAGTKQILDRYLILRKR
jgi:uncharacterized protein YjbI with pentapeptide repeats